MWMPHVMPVTSQPCWKGTVDEDCGNFLLLTVHMSCLLAVKDCGATATIWFSQTPDEFWLRGNYTVFSQSHKALEAVTNLSALWSICKSLIGLNLSIMSQSVMPEWPFWPLTSLFVKGTVCTETKVIHASCAAPSSVWVSATPSTCRYDVQLHMAL